MKTKFGQLIETTLIIIYLVAGAASSVYVVRSIMQSYVRAAVLMVID
jgi:type III secretory pathway component EscT